ncbi:unnamed protein product [Rhizophagus irregularis]|uniref:Uncharacterized protein n=1 Tax=Rhizophagus irregularis TaxID=588596 RepID=A0A915ZQ77_9GLOM|nr:unnamed protein product [Rhizophagus irregularis]
MIDFGKCKECGEAYLDGYYFDDIKEMGNDGFATAIWKDGPLYYDDIELVYTRGQNKKVALKRLCNSIPFKAQDIFLISWREERRIIGLYRSSSKISSEMKGRLLPQSPPEYIRNLFDCGRGRQKGINESLLNEIRKDPEVYGISQNPDTIVVKNMCIKNGVNLSNRLT